MDDLITKFQFKVVEAGCAPGSGRYGLQVNTTNDISPVFPYLNALLDSARYDHQNCILIWREKDRWYALRPHEIEIAQEKGIDDPVQSSKIASEIVDRINNVWRTHGCIAPYFTEKARPNVIDIFRLLPRTNCKQCGYPTCLVFAADLCEGKIKLESCTSLFKPEYAVNRQKLGDILSANQTY